MSDCDNTFRVSVLGRRSPGILPTHDLLDAEVVVESSFVGGHLSVCSYPSDRAVLQEWPSEVRETGPGAYEWRR
ncbi:MULTISPECIES: DUF5959 family protein [unclassified Streptomyces]|uniref:DUF5959 family protein n=1 Tax=Streptomyces sp. NBRC 14336 TaxID=3030992 RepID=UPI002552F5E0|nr:DUF5959 family protein [Streptomyces sp. NBRC 14336]